MTKEQVAAELGISVDAAISFFMRNPDLREGIAVSSQPGQKYAFRASYVELAKVKKHQIDPPTDWLAAYLETKDER